MIRVRAAALAIVGRVLFPHPANVAFMPAQRRLQLGALIATTFAWAASGCLGDYDLSDAGLGGAGGSAADETGGFGGVSSGGERASGGRSGGDGSTGGRYGGGGASGGASTGGESSTGGSAGSPSSANAFVTVWDTHPSSQHPLISGYDTIVLPLAPEGTYDLIVDWGDGSQSTITSADDPDGTHRFWQAGTYVVSMQGDIEGWRGYTAECTEWVTGDGGVEYCSATGSDSPKLREIRQWGTFRFGMIPNAFAEYEGLTVTATDVPDLSVPTTLSGAFFGCTSLTSIPTISEWDTSQVTDLGSLFHSTPFTGDLSTWDTSSATSMAGMFASTTAFNGEISAWDTAHVTTMAAMFAGAQAFSGDLSEWDTSSVTDMSNMFSTSVFDGDVSGWDTSSLVSAVSMFEGNVAFNGDLSGWDTSSLSTAAAMFRDASAFNADLSAWDTSNLTNMTTMFWGASAFNADISAWDTSQVTDMGRMFYAATSFDQDLSSWNVEALTFADGMFDESGLSLAHYSALLVGWASQSVQTGVYFGAVPIQFAESALDARTRLIEEHGWIIDDGGPAP